MDKRQQGFTLVEIAVVMVIIGLLLGGVLKGQELINSAKVKSVINDFRNTSTHIFAYQDRFRAMPGDDPGVANRLAGAVRASTGGSAGNGRIDGAWNSTTATDETVLVWQHVRLANLATGDGRSPGTDGIVITDWLPRNAAGGRLGVTGTTPIAGWSGTFFICQDNLSGSFARQIDIAMDDGLPASGSVKTTVHATGDGPVDASFNAVKAIWPHQARLQLYQVHAVTEGTDAQATVSVRMEEEGRILPVIAKVEKPQAVENLAEIVKSKSRRVYSPAQAEADAAAISQIYASDGRLAARVDPRIIRRSDNRVDLVFEILEGDVTEIERIGFVGNRAFSDKKLRNVRKPKQARGSPYEPDPLPPPG